MVDDNQHRSNQLLHLSSQYWSQQLTHSHIERKREREEEKERGREEKRVCVDRERKKRERDSEESGIYFTLRR